MTYEARHSRAGSRGSIAIRMILALALFVIALAIVAGIVAFWGSGDQDHSTRSVPAPIVTSSEPEGFDPAYWYEDELPDLSGTTPAPSGEEIE
jgi:hypothetical protein